MGGMVQETLAAMYVSIITELNLVNVVNELSNRFPVPDESYVESNVGSGANSLGPLGLTGSPARTQASLTAARSPMPAQSYEDFEDDDSTDSEDDLGDLQLLGIASH